MKYTVENLIKSFEKHSAEFEKRNQEHAEKYPDRDKNIDWDFNLSLALLTICKEIQRINNV